MAKTHKPMCFCRRCVRQRGEVAIQSVDLEAVERGRRLMAAAPDLLAALEMMVASHTKQWAYGAGCNCNECDAARFAIRKAKGRLS